MEEQAVGVRRHIDLVLLKLGAAADLRQTGVQRIKHLIQAADKDGAALVEVNLSFHPVE